MFELPKRISLSIQTATAMRKAITGGAWMEFVPSERRLCEIFQVSRPTVRAALQRLAQEGLIDIQHGRRNRLAPRPRARAKTESRLVALITAGPAAHISVMTYHGISEMRTQLAKHGFTTEILACRGRSADAQRRKLERFMRENRVFCSVLISVRQELQQWFSDRALPALVIGSCHPNVKLASLDVDYRSVCRHAAGIFLGKGHRRLALIVPNSGLAGDLASEQGFIEGVAKIRKSPDAGGIVVRHEGTPPSLTAKLDKLFRSAAPPTALLVAKPQFTFFVIMYLLRRGLAVPTVVSLIARDHDYLFESATSHYNFGGDVYAHRLCRLMLQMVGQGFLAPEPNLIFPEYHDEGTVRIVSRAVT